MVDTSHTLDTVRSLMTAPATREDLNQAHKICQALLVKAPDNAEILFLLGVLTREINGLKEALPYLLKSVESQPQGISSRLLLVRCLSDLGQWQAAVPFAQQALTLQSNDGRLDLDMSNMEAVSILGRHALYSQDWTSAAHYFESIINFLEVKVLSNKSGAQTFDPSVLPALADRPAHPILYLPVEVKAREFESKCLLALAALETGLNVVIGRTWVLSSGSYGDLPPGILLFKTLSGRDAMNMATAQVNGGHLIAALDEEAFGRSANARATKLNVDPLAVDVADLILVQGKAHQETWTELFDIDSGCLTVTGNPKTDLYRQKARPGAARASEKPMILFCTMSGNVNPKGRGFARTMEQALAAASNTTSPELMAELAILLRDSARFETAMIPQIEMAVKAISEKFPEADVVVRPHPVEDPLLWQGRFDAHTNVRVESDGPLTEWLKNCDVMVYLSGCATGLEARLHGTPAIHFAGDGIAADPEFGLSSTLNSPVRSAAEIVNALETILKRDQRDLDLGSLDHFIKSSGEDLISRSVAKALRELVDQHRKDGPDPLQTLRDLKSNRSNRFVLSPFHLQKFPDTSTDEVRAVLDGLAERFSLAKAGMIEEIEDGVFLISPLNA